MRVLIFSLALLLAGCADNKPSDTPSSETPSASTPDPTNVEIVTKIIPIPSGLSMLKLNISGTPSTPQFARFKNDWRVEVYNIDDNAQISGPIWYGQSDFGGKVDMLIPIEMFQAPMVVRACNDAAPVKFLGQPRHGKLKNMQTFIPANCNGQRIPVDPITTMLWRDLYSKGARFGAQSWDPSNVDCELMIKSGTLFYLTDRVQDVFNQFHRLDNILIPLIPAIRENSFLFYKTRPPLCIAEKRHNGGNLKEGRVLTPKNLSDDHEERFIHQFKEADRFEDHLSFFPPDEILKRQAEDTATIGRNGLLRRLCANGAQPKLFQPSLIVNGEILGKPNALYDLESQDFVGNIAVWKEPGELSDLTIKEYTIRHTNGYPRDSTNFEQVCSVTAMTVFSNQSAEPQEISLGSGLVLKDVFEKPVVWLSSDGDQVVDDQDTWAIIFNAELLSLQDHLLGICNPSLFCRGVPNFPVELINEVLIIELLGFRNGNWRDQLSMDFSPVSESLFLGLRADYMLDKDMSNNEEANFTTTISYLNKKNVNRTLSLCYEVADFLSRQHIDEVGMNESLPVVGAAEMVARSRCFSNSFANQRWQNYQVGLTSMNNSKGVMTNFYVPFAWMGPGTRYEIYLKRFNESVYQGPIASILPAVSGMSLEIPTISEGDELLFASEDACCQDFTVTVPCVPEFTSLPLPGVPVVIDTTGINTISVPPRPKSAPSNNKKETTTRPEKPKSNKADKPTDKPNPKPPAKPKPA